MVCFFPVGFVCVADVSSVSPSSEQTEPTQMLNQVKSICHRRLCLYSILHEL